MYVFVDESGNTGAHLFDEAQPIFLTVALMTRTDFDAIYTKPIANLARAAGDTQLHAAKLGVARIEEIARPLHKLLQRADPRFYISRVEKRYIVATKMFDLLFDPGENRAASPHIYLMRPLRITFAVKFAEIVTEDMARDFWASMMETNPDRARGGMIQFCDDVLALLPGIQDKGFVERIGPAIEWARENPEAIYFHSDGRIARQGHLPNLVGFGNLMDGVEVQSQAWRRPVRRIRHDRQSEFEAALRWWHDLYANASPERVPLMMGEMFKAQRAGGSTFEISTAEASPGIQVTDVIMWLFNRLHREKEIGADSWRMMQWVFRRARQNDFSFDGVLGALDERYAHIMTEPMDEARLDAAREQLAMIDAATKGRVEAYRAEKDAKQIEGDKA
ncbi:MULTISPECIES: DUF3800 domain-containing protein [unclassified Novosphingobium]|uniref:DUF3800 domain-containing protein n=1 Tax=unclassified Novosphingobium TaxID=2644732 RepID=UPI001494F6AB|nr:MULTISPECIES: DUF3800 domain-containing protein [unclassified Novosphingobium]MBB3358817.1 hypothetical protein [Novosphingobium sp. BK256]MBB3375178.1 hypothetical protein [Novosphingobium sp. BK280]MBB3379134.1 hypothetical protein [Novosphingobium sp. BK258]MBB3420828.1 hypothetical protein [Novosphingobium sp. BK267]MBB3449599.1 hypothetical protein [Novosphingobium sp. BK352]